MSSIGRGFAGNHVEANVLTDVCDIKSGVIERAKPYLLLVSRTGNVSLFSYLLGFRAALYCKLLLHAPILQQV